MHPICGRQYGHIARAALPAVAGRNNGCIDGIGRHPAPHEESGADQGRDCYPDGDQIRPSQRGNQFVPGRQRNADGERQRESDGAGGELLHDMRALLNLGQHRVRRFGEDGKK